MEIIRTPRNPIIIVRHTNFLCHEWSDEGVGGIVSRNPHGLLDVPVLVLYSRENCYSVTLFPETNSTLKPSFQPAEN